MRKIILIFILIFTLSLISCSPKPEPINYGQDVCDLCKMNITDNKFAAELVTKKGKVYKFDSIECLFNFKNLEIEGVEIHSEWVNDFSNPGQLINLKEAYFLQSDVFRSPMGLNVLSFSSKEEREKIINQYGGKVLTYDEVFELANTE
ncbi:MAG: nitrous oxide reductase accessory protein NosL [Ignavibacteria bacterium]